MKFNKGQVLVELLLAMAVSSVALVAMAQVATKSLANSTYSKNRSEANKYAVQAIEWIRNQRKVLPWNQFVAFDSTGFADPKSYCLNRDLGVLPQSSIISLGQGCGCTLGMQDGKINTSDTCGHTTIFQRRASFTPNTPTNNQQTVMVTVSWTDKLGTQSSNQTIIFKQY